MNPLVFEPYLRPQIWGGRLLAERLGKQLPDSRTYGEAWELSGHPHHVSRVAEGPLAGQLLSDLWLQQRADLAGPGSRDEHFPLLVKYLDCAELLSVQVHPNDAQARLLLGEERGKTEAWVVLEAQPESVIYAGLRAGVGRDELLAHLKTGNVAECLHQITPHAGDCLFLPAGTVHAVGKGVLMAEIQQSSDATFRLFDWNRAGPDGRPRELHLEAALQSIDWSLGPVNPIPVDAVASEPTAIHVQPLVNCPYFQFRRVTLPYGKRWHNRSSAPDGKAQRMVIALVLSGSATLSSDTDDWHRQFQAGVTVLIPHTAPADLAWRSDSGTCTFLEVTLP